MTLILCFKKRKSELLTILSFLLSNRASCLSKQCVFALKSKKFGMVNVVLEASLTS
jgi:hypothetical protein